VHTGIAGTGVVGVLRNGSGSAPSACAPTSTRCRCRREPLRAPLAPRRPHARLRPRRPHDHAAGRGLAPRQARDFDGTVHFIFQPAEEMGKAGALKMVQEGLFDRFPCEAVFALHNFAVPTGSFALNPGPLMASSNTWRVTLHGRGTHASQPHTGIDPVAAVLDLGQQLQTLVARAIPSTERALLAVTQVQGSGAPNVIPDEAWVGRHRAHLSPPRPPTASRPASGAWPKASPPRTAAGPR
jgi:hippurate hydrolase